MKDVVSVELMRKSDAAETEKTPAVELMRRAAVGIFEEMKREGFGSPTAIVCGIGNNAGDGFALAELMLGEGLDCTIFLLTDSFSPSGRYYFERCTERGVKVSKKLELEGFKTVVDCIFGTGLHGRVEEPYRSAVEAINSSKAYVVSADISSGISGDSGAAVDGVAVRADLTVSIGSFKQGHFLGSAKDYMKKCVNRPIGIELLEKAAKLIEPSDIAHLLVRDKNDSNKGDFGYVALIGGSLEYSGAAKLASIALSSLRVGAGVSKLAVPRSIANAVLPYILESTLFLLDETNGCYRFERETTERLLRNTKAAAVGMGMGRSNELRRLLQYLLSEYRGRLVIDADGLNELSELSTNRLRELRSPELKLILTPHPKEFERLSGISIAEQRLDPVKAAVGYARENDVILLLKGASTIVTDGSETYIIDRGCVGMSTAGSGDVLSGILCGLCGYAPEESLTLAVAAGAYINGLAGELAMSDVPAVSMLSSDTAAHIPEAVKRILG